MKRRLLCTTAAALLGVHAANASDTSNEVRLQLLYSSDDNTHAYRFHDLEDSGWLVDSSFLYTSDSPKGTWELEANQLGLGTREIFFRFRSPGTFAFELNYDESVFNEDHSGSTPFIGTTQSDARTLTLPASWQSGVTTGDFDLDDYQENFFLGVRRQNLEARAKQQFSESLWSSLSISLQNRSGKRRQGTAIYFNAVNPQAAFLPITIDEDSTQVEWQSGYQSDQFDAVISYRLLEFDNNIEATRWQNPYVSGFGANVDYPAGVGEVGADPDYRQHLVQLSASYRLTPSIRFALDANSSQTRQTGDLLPYSANQNLSVIEPLPVDQFDDPLRNNTINVVAYWQPVKNLGVDVRYLFNERDNTASRYPWQYIPGDGINQPGAEFSVFNRPLDFEKERLVVNANLRLSRRQKLEASYGVERVFRNYAAVEDTDEEQFGVAYRFNTSKWRHHAKIDYRNKAGSTYEWSRSFFQLLPVSLINQIADDQRWINHPALRQYHLANRQQLAAQYQSNVNLREDWQLQFKATRTLTEFDKSQLGLRYDHERGVHLALSWFPDNKLSGSAYADYRKQSRAQRGRDFRGGIEKPANRSATPLPQGSNPSRNYDLTETNEIFSLGLDFAWVRSEKLSFEGHYALNLAQSSPSYDSQLTTPDLSDLETTVHSLELGATWQFSQQLNLSGRYGYYRYQDIDFTVAAAQHGLLDKILTNNPVEANEVVNSLFFSLAFKF